MLVLCLCRSKVTVFLASALVETTRGASSSTNAVMATGTVRQAATRRAVRYARPGSFLATWTLWPATQPRSAAITRSSARTGRMRRTATSASPGTSTAGPTFAFLKRGSATARRTAWTGATRGTAWQPCPGKWSRRLWSAAWCAACCWSSHSDALSSYTRSGAESTGGRRFCLSAAACNRVHLATLCLSGVLLCVSQSFWDPDDPYGGRVCSKGSSALL